MRINRLSIHVRVCNCIMRYKELTARLGGFEERREWETFWWSPKGSGEGCVLLGARHTAARAPA